MGIILYIAGIFQSPAIFISLIACVGLILQRKHVSDIIKGTFKAMLGIFVLLIGVDVIIGAMGPMTQAFSSLSTRESAPLADYGAFMEQWGSNMGIIMVVGFVINLLLAKWTPLKTVYLTGHMMLFYSMLWLGLGVQFGFKGSTLMVFAIIGYVITISITPQLLMKDMEHLTGKREFSIGHSGTLWCFVASRVGQLAAKTVPKEKPSPNMEKMSFPKGLDFMKDTTLTGGLIMVCVFAVIAIALPSPIRTEVYGNDVVVFTLTNGMRFGAGIVILLQGCRMMMAEIIPAFTGISKKIVPGAVPALDIPLIYPYGPNSLMFGYIFALGASLVAMTAINMSGVSLYVLVPLTAAVYFDVASGCVFANSYGGRRGVIWWGLIGGCAIMLITTVAMPLVSNTVGTFVQQMGFSECSVWVIIVGYITHFFQLIVG